MPRSARYTIVIRGRADERTLRPVLDEFRIETTDGGTTRIVGEVLDAAHLHGLLAHFTSMAAEIIEVRRLDRFDPTSTTPVTTTPNTTT